MSVDINWDKITGGPAGAELATKIRDFIDDQFQSMSLPPFIKSVKVQKFDFGTIGPSVDILDIADPLPDFYEENREADEADEEDDVEADEEDLTPSVTSRQHRRENSLATMSSRGGVNPGPYSARGMDYSPFSTPGIPGGTSNLNYCSMSPYRHHWGGPAQTPLAAVASGTASSHQRHHSYQHHQHHRSFPSQGSIFIPPGMIHSPTGGTRPSLMSLPTGSLAAFAHQLQHRPPPVSLTTAVMNKRRDMVAQTAAIAASSTNSCAGPQQPKSRHPSHGSLNSVDLNPPTAGPSGPSSSLRLKHKASVSTFAAPSSIGGSTGREAVAAAAAAAAIGTSTSSAARVHKWAAQTGPQQAPLSPASDPDEESGATDDAFDDADVASGVDGDDAEAEAAAGSKEPRADDTQAVFRIVYAGNLQLSLTAELLLDYPMPAFVGIPIHLNITGLSFDGVGVVAKIRRRAHFCFLSPDDAQAYADDVGGSAEVTDAGGEENNAGAAVGEVGGLLKEVKIESEIGQSSDGGRQTLRNVGKVERFILEKVRSIFEDELVYPSYWTFLI